MNKRELAAAVAEAHGLDNSTASAVVDTVFGTITERVAADDAVTISGFGTFERRHRAARTGRNPQTGEDIQIAETHVPGFKAAAGLKRAVAGE